MVVKLESLFFHLGQISTSLFSDVESLYDNEWHQRIFRQITTKRETSQTTLVITQVWRLRSSEGYYSLTLHINRKGCTIALQCGFLWSIVDGWLLHLSFHFVSKTYWSLIYNMCVSFKAIICWHCLSIFVYNYVRSIQL